MPRSLPVTLRAIGVGLCLVALIGCTAEDVPDVTDLPAQADTSTDIVDPADVMKDTLVPDDLATAPEVSADTSTADTSTAETDASQADTGETTGPGTDDQDGDGIEDAVDNCPTIPNRVQRDLNSNGIGDVCDPDEPTTGVAFYGSFTEPCNVFGCPDDRNLDLYRMDFDLADGSVTYTRLTNNSDGEANSEQPDGGPDDDIPLALSQDRTWLYFQNRLSDHVNIRRVATDGSASPTLLTPADANAHFVHLSADATKLYFMSDADGDFDLYVVSAVDGSGLQNLSANDEQKEKLEVVLSDGSGAIVRLGPEGNDPEGTGADGELYFVRFADGVWIQLTDDKVWNRYQAISSDGSWMAYRRPIDENDDGKQEKGSGELWVVRTDGSEPATRLLSVTEGQMGDIHRITHDNMRVLYDFKSPDSSITQVYALTLDGKQAPVQLTQPASGESSYYRMLTGDAKTLIYTSNDVADGFGDVEVYTLPTTGGAATLVSDIANEAIVLPVAVLDAQGTVVIEGNFDGGDYDLYVGALDGSGMQGVVLNTFFSDTFSGASPGGTYVFFRNCGHDYTESALGCSDFANDHDIYVTRSDGTGEIIPLTQNDTGDVFWRAFMVTP